MARLRCRGSRPEYPSMGLPARHLPHYPMVLHRGGYPDGS